MKTQIRSLLTLSCAAAASLLSQTVYGQMPTPTPAITFTEINDTTLTAVYNLEPSTSITVIPEGIDQWQVQLPGNLLAESDATWAEPSGINAGNQVTHPSVHLFVVGSDVSGASGFPNNTQSSSPIANDVAGAGPSPISVYGVFNDLGDTPTTVPDTGSTLGLLALALAALFGASRFRALRLA